MTLFKSSFILAASALLSAGLHAHHSTRGIYHQDREIELTGKVVEWRFINPHPYLIVEAEAEDGTVREWDVSYGGAAVVHLRRQGYAADTFKPGDTIVVRGKPAIAEGVYGVLIEGGNHPTWPDGTEVVKGGSMF
jgi:hypothetical protein